VSLAEHVTGEAPVVTADEVLSNARRLAASLPARSAEIERLRRLPDDVVAVLRDAGVFTMAMPRAWGGPEMTPRQMCEVVEVLAAGDAAVGWCGGIAADSGLYSAYLDDVPARELYPRLDLATAGWIFPAGRAEPVGGGYRISGHWAFGSGITHADRVVCGCVEYADGTPVLLPNGLPAWRVAVVPASAVTLVDTWQVTGLLGTGSLDYEVDGLEVAAAHTFSFFRGPRRPGPLYARADNFLSKLSGVPLGVGRAALDWTRGFLATKVETPTGRPAGANPRVQANLAKAEALVSASRAYVHRTLDDVWDALLAGREPERGSAALARQFAFESCRQAVQLLYDTVGAAAIYTERTPLDRHLRDLVTASQHVTAQERMREWVGELRLGGSPSFPFL
jgi:alkylation response protein AidB-like acyl-CoA dehydrogenase